MKNIKEQQYLTFYLYDEIYCLEVLKIKEIIPFGIITPVPLMQKFIKGVMNVRGMVVPVVSLADRLKITKVSGNRKISIIIVTIMHDGEKTDFGILVTKVNKVFNIPSTDLEPAPLFGTKLRRDFIKHIGKINGEFITILDIDNILNIAELSSILDESFANECLF